MQDILDNAIVSGKSLTDSEFAARLEEADPGTSQRSEFIFPLTEATAKIRTPGQPAVYLCGNSLGLQPRRTREYIQQDLDKWAEFGVEGHFRGERPWLTIDETVRDESAALVGALPSEVVVMNSLTVNLHLLMVSFYRPTPARWKILIEEHAFPSDTYAVASQLRLHGYDPTVGLVMVKPREGEETLRTEDILTTIQSHGASLACILLPGVQYYTGQALDIPVITRAGHAAGAMVGWDLAHAAGNVSLQLHDWGVDFAAWCSYKYLNSGPGGIAGAFVHSKHELGVDSEGKQLPRLAGWWGHRKEDRFKMGPDFNPTPGAAGWQLSNPPVFQTAALRASLDIFRSAGGMSALRSRSLVLTRYLEVLLGCEVPEDVHVLSPSQPLMRGSQLSLVFTLPVKDVQERLGEEGVIVDVREPFVMRVAPTALYNTAHDVLDFVRTLKAVLAQLKSGKPDSTQKVTA